MESLQNKITALCSHIIFLFIALSKIENRTVDKELNSKVRIKSDLKVITI